MTDHKSELRKAIRDASQSVERGYKARNPDAERLKVRLETGVYVPRSKEVKDIPRKAVALFLSNPQSLGMTNIELAQTLGREIGRKVPGNILTEQFGGKTRKGIEDLLEARGVNLDLDIHNTASKIKKALKARATGSQSVVIFEGRVTFTDNALIVGEKAFPIQTGRRIHVGSKKLNVDVLKALLF